MDVKYIVFFVLIQIIQTIRAEDSSNRLSKTGDLGTIIKNPKDLHDRLLNLEYKNKFCEIIVSNERSADQKKVSASSSEYFERIFSDNESEFEIEFVSFETILSLIEYFYTGIISVSEKNLHEIMGLATFAKITPLIEGCEKIFEKQMYSKNCISTWKLAKSGNYENLKKIAFEYIRQNYTKISRSPEFLDLDIPEILKILSSDIAVTSEMIIFDSVKKWINRDRASRKPYLNVLSNFIKFEHLPKNILLSASRNLCSVNSSSICHDKIINALQQMEKNNTESADGRFRYSNSTLMVIGHIEKSKSFEIFDLRKEAWIKIGNFKCDSTQYSAVLLDDKVMLIGGLKNKIEVNTVQSYDLNTGVMENLPPMKYVRSLPSAVEFKGSVYVIGGWDGKYLIPNVEMWDPVSKIWKEVTPISTGRAGCGAAVLDEEIFVVGGLSDEWYLTEVQSYNPATNKWRIRASMNEKRFLHGVAVAGGYLYAMGGRLNSSALNTAERYDPTIDKWTAIHSLNETRRGMAAASLYGKLVIVGGATVSIAHNSMEMYDDENDKWISMPSLNSRRFLLNAFEIPWRLAEATLSRKVPK